MDFLCINLVIGGQLVWMILEVFSNLSDSMILCQMAGGGGAPDAMGSRQGHMYGYQWHETWWGWIIGWT